jgi:predicted dienelactone hydrolase
MHKRIFGAVLAILTLALVQFLAAPTRALAAENPYERGPAPTSSSVDATRGPFATASTSVSRLSVSGFGGGTIYYPTSTAEGTFGVVAIAPGFTATQSSIAWLGPRIASQGFVVITIDTNSVYDQPASRGDQLLAALDYLTGRSSVRTRVDATRLAVMGHSMGGGGTLEAAADRPSLQAAIPLTGWDTRKSFSTNRVPTLVVGAETDTAERDVREGVPRAQQRLALRAQHAEHHDRPLLDLLAEAVRGQRHPVRAVPLRDRRRQRHRDLRLPQHLPADLSRDPGPSAARRRAAPTRGLSRASR